MRLGRIPWINCYPVYGALDRGLVPCDAEVVSGTASDLNDLMAAGELDLSVVSAVEYARNAAAYHLLPDLAISCDGPVHSVRLFSRRPITDLDGATVLLSSSSRTSVLLLELLCRHRWAVNPRFATVRAEATDLKALAQFPHDAVLVIGDAALLLASRGMYPHHVDLGEAWKDWGLHHLDLLADQAWATSGIARQVCRDYLGDLDYRFSYRHLAGLTDFFRRLAQDGLVPDGSLSFISAA